MGSAWIRRDPTNARTCSIAIMLPSGLNEMPRSANLGRAMVSQARSTSDQMDARMQKSATHTSEQPSGDQRTEEMPAGPSSILQVQSASSADQTWGREAWEAWKGGKGAA